MTIKKVYSLQGSKYQFLQGGQRRGRSRMMGAIVSVQWKYRRGWAATWAVGPSEPTEHEYCLSEQWGGVVVALIKQWSCEEHKGTSQLHCSTDEVLWLRCMRGIFLCWQKNKSVWGKITSTFRKEHWVALGGMQHLLDKICFSIPISHRINSGHLPSAVWIQNIIVYHGKTLNAIVWQTCQRLKVEWNFSKLLKVDFQKAAESS